MKQKESTIENVMEILVETFKPQDGYVLCLKSLPANLKAYGDFQWPEIGHVKAPDWRPIQDCGNGLHAFLWGAGDSDLACSDSDAKWLVLTVKEDGMIDLSGKVKFEECEVVYCGARETAIAIIQAHAPAGTAVMFSTLTGGYASTLTGGYASTLTGGNRSTLTGGDASTLTGGNRSTLTGGDASTLTGGYASTLTGGDASTLTGGYASTLTGGLWTVLVWRFWNNKSEQYEQKCAMVDGINFLPGMKYKLNDNYEIVQVNDTEA
jgi:hypothetical protein